MSSPIDINQLIQCFNMTMLNNQKAVDEAELFLQKCLPIQSFPLLLVQIADNSENEFPVRLAAATHLKLICEKHWRTREQFTLHTSDKMNLKNSGLDIITRIANFHQLIRIYESMFSKMIEYDFPNEWPTLMEQILARMKAMTSFEETLGCLIFYKEIIRKYEYLLNEDRNPMLEIIENTFPLLQEITTKLIQNYNDQSGILISIILKTFYASIHLELPDYFHKDVNLHVWLVFFKTILDAPIPEQLKQKSENEDVVIKMSKHFFWKNVKWSGRILQRFIQKFGNTKYKNEKDTPAGYSFREKYAVPFLESCLGYLIKQKIEFVPSKVLLVANKYIYYSLKIEKTSIALITHADKLLFDFLIPLCFINKKDEEIWNNDPIEFIRKEEDFTNMDCNVKNIAIDLIEAISKMIDPITNETFLIKIYKYMVECFTKGIDPRNGQPVSILLKEALMLNFGHLKTDLLEIPGVKEQIEGLIISSILPEFNNSIGFLRARTCWLFGKFANLPWENNDCLLEIVKGLFSLLNDKELPVQMKAAISLNCFLTRSLTQELLKPALPKLLEIYLMLMDSIDSEDIVAALEGIIDNYNEEIIPYAKELINHLSLAFIKMATKGNTNENDDGDDDIGESEIAAGGCLEAVKRILMINLPNQTYIETEQFFYPVFDFIFSDEGVDFLMEGISCFNLFLYNSSVISQEMWRYFPIICYSITGTPPTINLNQANLDEVMRKRIENVKEGNHFEYADSMIGPIQNYISKGKANFLSLMDPFGISFLEHIFNLVAKVYSIGLRGSDDLDMICTTTLFITIIENFPGQIDNILPRILGIAIENLNLKKSKQLKVINIQVVAIALWYNPVAVVSYLEANQLTQNFFQLWFSLLTHFKTDFDKIRMLFGLTSILKIPQNQLPPVIMGSMPQLIKYIVKLTSEILELREKDVDSKYSEAEEDFDEDKDNAEYKKTLDKIENFKNGNIANDEDEEDDEDEDFDELDEWQNDAAHFYDSPLEEVDEILFVQSTLEQLMNSNTQYYQAVIGILDEGEKQILSKNFNEAQVQYKECNFHNLPQI